MAPTTVEERIREIQRKTGSTRKEAIRKLKASQRAARKAKAPKGDRSVDARSAAANDKPEVPAPVKPATAKDGKTVGQAVAAAVNKLDSPVAARGSDCCSPHSGPGSCSRTSRRCRAGSGCCACEAHQRRGHQGRTPPARHSGPSLSGGAKRSLRRS